MKNTNIKVIFEKTFQRKQCPKEIDGEYIRTVKVWVSTK